MKLRPASTRLRGRRARWNTNTSSAARRLARIISRLTGMRLVAAPVVPDVFANRSMPLGHVTSFRCGNGADQ